MIYAPSQYELDTKLDSDFIYIIPRSKWYNFIRDITSNSKVKLKLPISENIDKVNRIPKEVFQEDCILIHDYELKCQQIFKNEIPYYINKYNSFKYKESKFKKVTITLNNLQLEFDKYNVITIPLNKIEDAIKKNKDLYSNLERDRIFAQNVKFIKYKGDKFKDIVKERNIKVWSAAYCTMCGKPVQFKFGKDNVKIINKCTCGNNQLHKDELTYDEFAVYIAGQTEPLVKKLYNDFWFNEDKHDK